MSLLPDDPQLAQLLDNYLSRLQAGQRPARDRLLAQHPELKSALDCLEALEQIAPESAVKGSGTPLPVVSDAVRAAEGGAADSATGATVAAPGELLPRPFGQYELLEEIGRGGMGVVYKARQKDLERIVALKMVLATHLASAEHVRRFQVEAKAAARLRHPHIVHIHEVGQIHGQHYFTMEYVEGESLAQRLARGTLDLPTAVQLLAGVARAVEHLHRQEIVHRDLKPSNILLDAEGRPYVTDFGLAKVFAPGSQATTTGVIAGTPSYMSPEQASGQSERIGPASDIYSLGAMLYELLTRQPPFKADNPLDVVIQVLSSEPAAPRSLNPSVPRLLEMICRKCLSKSPEDRYASAGALADDLERFLRGEPLQLRPPSVGQWFLRWTRQQPALSARLGALSLFYLIEMVNYGVGGVDRKFHIEVSVLAGLWAVCSVICQLLETQGVWAMSAQLAWGTLDAALLLALLFVGNGVASPLVVAYPLLIVGSAMWFRVRFVWYMTGLSLLSYSILVADFYGRRCALQEGFDARFDRHVIFAAALLVTGALVSYLVHRVRTLSTFYGRSTP